jgi:hypothetical protein
MVALTAVVAGGALSLACSTQYSGTLAQQVNEWSTMTQFPSAASALQSDFRDFNKLGAHVAPGVLRTYCDVMVTDALNANQNLPTPDAQVTDVLADAYNLAGESGRNCLSGANGNTVLLMRAQRQRVTAAHELIKALATIDALGPA